MSEPLSFAAFHESKSSDSHISDSFSAVRILLISASVVLCRSVVLSSVAISDMRRSRSWNGDAFCTVPFPVVSGCTFDAISGILVLMARIRKYGRLGWSVDGHFHRGQVAFPSLPR